MSVKSRPSSPPLPRHRARTQELCGQLREMAQRLGPDAQMPKLLELCGQFGASQHTLVRAIQELERQDVLYSVRSVGIFVKPQVRRNIRLLCDATRFLSGGTPFWTILLDAARERALSHSEEFVVQPVLRSNEALASAQKTFLEDSRAGRVDAVMAVGVERELTDWLVGLGVPLASFACYSPHRVAIDQEAITRMGVEDLLARGCKRISLWIAPLYKEVDDACIAIFEQRLHEAGQTPHSIRIADQWPKDMPKIQPSRQEEGFKVARELFLSAERPDGMVILNDHLTHGVLIALDKVGLRAGRDVQIATQTNLGSPMLLGREDQIVSLEIDPTEIVEALFSLIEAQLSEQAQVPLCLPIQPHLRPPTLV